MRKPLAMDLPQSTSGGGCDGWCDLYGTKNGLAAYLLLIISQHMIWDRPFIYNIHKYYKEKLTPSDLEGCLYIVVLGLCRIVP